MCLSPELRQESKMSNFSSSPLPDLGAAPYLGLSSTSSTPRKILSNFPHSQNRAFSGLAPVAFAKCSQKRACGASYPPPTCTGATLRETRAFHRARPADPPFRWIKWLRVGPPSHLSSFLKSTSVLPPLFRIRVRGGGALDSA